DLEVRDAAGADGRRVFGEDREVGQLAGLDRALYVFGLAGVGGAPRVGAQRLFGGDRFGRVERGAVGGAAVDHVVDAEQRGAGHDRTVGAAGQHQAGVEHGALPVEPWVPGGADGGEHPVADLRGEAALTDGDHAERGGAGDLVRAGGGEVLDPVPRVVARVPAGRGVERVEGEVDRAVADRVRGDPPAGPVRGDDRVGQAGGVGLQVAPVRGAAAAPVAVVRLGHGGGPADERPVGEDLHRAE